MKKFDKEFSDAYIKRLLHEEIEAEKKIFYENKSPVDKIIYDIRNRKIQNDLIELYLKCNWYEKILLIILQISSCILPFALLAAMGSLMWCYICFGLFFTILITGPSLSYSRNRKQIEKTKP